MKRGKSLILFVFIFSAIGLLQAEESSFEIDLRGYSNTNFMFYNIPDGYQMLGIEKGTYFEFSNMTRAALISTPAEWVTAEIAYSISPSVSDLNRRALAFNAPSVDKYRLIDVPEFISEYEYGSVSQNIDRVTAQFRTPFADITAGRQAISFGSGRFFNPTDVFSPFSYQALNKEEKTGVDALRVQVPIGKMSEIDFGYVFGAEADWKKSAAFIRGKFDLKGTDISIIAMEYKTHFMTGINISSSIKGAGVWLEAAYTMSRLLENYDHEGDFFRISAGADYYFPGDFYLFVEYHYSSAGTIDKKDYLFNSLTKKSAYKDSGVYLLGEHYFAPGFNWQVHPLVGLSLAVLMNITDPSAMISPKISFSLEEDIFIDLGASINAGKRIKNSEFKSEFGSYPDFYYLSARLYF
jgi:hypothetical protein